MFHIRVEDELFGEDWLKRFATKILDAKYKKTDVVEVVKGLTHLNAHQKADLPWVLEENDKMIDGTLGVYPHKKVHIDIDPNAKPVHSRPYLVPWIHLKTFKKGTQPSCENWCFSITTREWMGVTLIHQSKKDGRVCWISNLHQLNNVIRRKQYPLLIITDILRKHSG